ncbi:hypothetical protein GCM10027176_20960 [Actinoallomurus bryophytorum]|uniref:Excreted virulence factor EspC (Type VII ESX diderm) n=1 Tax=Actinoallomurus bryophytorum TaxID=1490222 RepID=A0A543CKK5_9ACTN|nr:hypothetical protein [Actinoallomurus bryophytorum]TQL97632.1 hypothetical protein FB559_3230 [Actinoallomurus bryophytorum]
MDDQQPSISALINNGGQRSYSSQAASLPSVRSLPRQAPSLPPRASDQERYVTSEGIESVRKKIDTDLKQFFTDVKTYVDDTDLSFPGWGALGSLLIGFQYSHIQNDVRQKADDGHDTADAMATALGVVKTNWRNAEDANTVVYQ